MLNNEQNVQLFCENSNSAKLSVRSCALVAETRVCGNCKNFKLDVGANVMGTCSKKLMIVISSMYVTYKIEEGSCFE
jgi:hypothetical protein